MRADRLKSGIPLPDDTWNALLTAARDVGIEEPRVQEFSKLGVPSALGRGANP
jgi:hypothetical protein